MVCNCSSSAQPLSHVRLFVTPWIAGHQASLSITSSQSLLKFISSEFVMPSNHLIFCRPLLLPSIFPSIWVFSNESFPPIRWPKYWSFSFSISPSNEYSGLISFRFDWFELLTSNLMPPTKSKSLSDPLSQAWSPIPTSHTNVNAKQGPVGSRVQRPFCPPFRVGRPAASTTFSEFQRAE